MHIRSPTIPSWRRWVSRVWESERDLWTKEISSNSGAAKIWKFFFQYFSAKQTVPSGKLISLLFMEINVIKNKIKYLDNNFFCLGWTRDENVLTKIWILAHFMTFQDFFYTKIQRNWWINFYYSFSIMEKGHKKSYWLMIMAILKRLPFIV